MLSHKISVIFSWLVSKKLEIVSFSGELNGLEEFHGNETTADTVEPF
ncbi:hypothetical protein CP10139811_0071 [Chlamydia ibidis]|uniref:Uncharacterized protein n=2 Tax=Chlamydia ibidis TaxID=1405396 RepID=S7J5L0_9CHLA|nr:hypothetical protein CP10139811_0071 [Chlamydia ibidis]EQM62639.1 hypothetical protein H359_0514 [Chlamydia ibidis 10-1398/6]